MMKLLVICVCFSIVLGRPSNVVEDKQEDKFSFFNKLFALDKNSVTDWFPSIHHFSNGTLEGDDFSNGNSITSFSRETMVWPNIAVFGDYAYSDPNQTSLVGTGLVLPNRDALFYYAKELNSKNHTFVWTYQH